jgi:hypothetical protein
MVGPCALSIGANVNAMAVRIRIVRIRFVHPSQLGVVLSRGRPARRMSLDVVDHVPNEEGRAQSPFKHDETQQDAPHNGEGSEENTLAPREWTRRYHNGCCGKRAHVAPNPASHEPQQRQAAAPAGLKAAQPRSLQNTVERESC